MKPRLKSTRAARDLIKAHEPFLATAERRGKRWVVGYGHTAAAKEGVSLKPEDAELLLIYDVLQAEQAIDAAVGAEMAAAMRDALVSFAASVGVRAFKVSDVARLAKAGRHREAAAAIETWVRAEEDGRLVVSERLSRRRAAEKALYLTGLEDSSAVAAVLTADAEVAEGAQTVSPPSAANDAVDVSPVETQAEGETTDAQSSESSEAISEPDTEEQGDSESEDATLEDEAERAQFERDFVVEPVTPVGGVVEVIVEDAAELTPTDAAAESEPEVPLTTASAPSAEDQEVEAPSVADLAEQSDDPDQEDEALADPAAALQALTEAAEGEDLVEIDIDIDAEPDLAAVTPEAEEASETPSEPAPADDGDPVSDTPDPSSDAVASVDAEPVEAPATEREEPPVLVSAAAPVLDDVDPVKEAQDAAIASVMARMAEEISGSISSPAPQSREGVRLGYSFLSTAHVDLAKGEPLVQPQPEPQPDEPEAPAPKPVAKPRSHNSLLSSPVAPMGLLSGAVSVQSAPVEPVAPVNTDTSADPEAGAQDTEASQPEAEPSAAQAIAKDEAEAPSDVDDSPQLRAPTQPSDHAPPHPAMAPAAAPGVSGDVEGPDHPDKGDAEPALDDHEDLHPEVVAGSEVAASPTPKPQSSGGDKMFMVSLLVGGAMVGLGGWEIGANLDAYMELGLSYSPLGPIVFGAGVLLSTASAWFIIGRKDS